MLFLLDLAEFSCSAFRRGANSQLPCAGVTLLFILWIKSAVVFISDHLGKSIPIVPHFSSE